MPINGSNINQAEGLISSLQKKLDSQRSQFGDMGPPSPEMARTQANLDRLRSEVNEYRSASRPVDENGRLTQDLQPTPTSPRNEVAPRTSGFGQTYWYEPTVEQVQQAIISDPSLSQRLNLTSWTSSPDQIASIDKDSTAYKAVADDMWNQAANNAESKGEGLKRYSSVKLTDSPFDYLAGGAGRIISSLASGADTGLTGGSVRRAGSEMDKYMTDAAAERGQSWQSYTPPNVDENIALIGQVGGTLSPLSPGNVVTRGIAQLGNYGSRGVLGKAGLSALGGAAASNVEGVLQDANTGLEQGSSVDDILSQAYQNAPSRTVAGLVLGGGLDLAGQAAGAVAKAGNTNDLKLLREAGGDTNVIKGVTAPKAIKENIAAHEAGATGEVGFPGDIAAAKVAPNIHESMKSQIRSERDRIATETEQYLSHPDIAAQQESMKPIAENVLGMFSKGTFQGPVSGDLLHANPEAVNTFRKVLGSIGEFKYVDPGDSSALIDQGDGIILGNSHLKALGLKTEPGRVAVYVPAKTNARALLEMEDMIDEKLKMAGTPGGINNPIWKNINTAVKGVRDRFGVVQPETVPPIPLERAPVPSAPPAAPESINPTSPTNAAPAPQSTDTIPVGQVRNIRREPTPSVYRDPEAANVEGFNRRNPEDRWSGMAPEAQKSVDELDYNANIQAQKREAERMAAWGQPSVEAPRLNKEEFEREVQRRLGNNPHERRLPLLKRGIRDTRLPDEINAKIDEEVSKRLGRPIAEIDEIKRTPTKPALGSESFVDDGSFVNWSHIDSEAKDPSAIDLSPSEAPEAIPSKMGLESQLDAQLLQRNIDDQIRLEQEAMGKRSAENAYEKGTTVPNQGNFNIDDVVKEVEQYGGVEHAGRLNMGMRKGSLDAEIAKYKGKNANEVAQNLEHPIDLSLDNGALMLRDGRHRLEAAKRAGATHIKARVRKYNSEGKAEEVGVVNLPIKTKPKQYEATLDDGTKVRGLSALRRQQHLAQKKLEEAESATGAGSLKGVTSRVLDFGRGPGQAAQDAALLEEARRIGLEKELRETAGTAAYQRLLPQAWGLSGRGFFRSGVDALKLHADPVLRAMAGSPPNPFADPLSPTGRIAEYMLKEPINLTQGLPAARYAPLAAEEYQDYQERKKNEF